MPKRKYMSEDMQALVAIRCGRRCCLCFGLNNDFQEKSGQIAHLDGDPSNNDSDNLAFLCLDHHNEYDSRSKQSKRLLPKEVKHYREELYKAMANFRQGKTLLSESCIERGFLIGERLRFIRKGLELQSSEFVEMINCPSEKTYLGMEDNSVECNEQVIKGIYNAFGILPNFVKHGYWPMIKTQNIDWLNDPANSANHILSSSPRFLWLIINNSSAKRDLPVISDLKNLYLKLRDSYLATGLIVEIKPKKFRIYNLYVSMDVDELRNRSDINFSLFKFLRVLTEKAFDFRVLQIASFKDFNRILEGCTFPERMIKKYYGNYGFAYDLLDFPRKNFGAPEYQYKYGRWINSYHESLKEIVGQASNNASH